MDRPLCRYCPPSGRAAQSGQNMRNQRRRGGFSVRPGDRDHLGRLVHGHCLRGCKTAEKQADIVVDRHPRRQAAAIWRFGAGYRCGMPGLVTSAAICDQSARDRSCRAMPSASARARASGLSSQASGIAPPAASARQVATPRPAKAQHGDRAPFIALHRDHVRAFQPDGAAPRHLLFRGLCPRAGPFWPASPRVFAAR